MFRLTAPEKIVEKYRNKIAELEKAGTDLQGHDNPVYAAMIEETDRSVGAVIDKLNELKLREKTLVLFISDNGGLSKYTSQPDIFEKMKNELEKCYARFGAVKTLSPNPEYDTVSAQEERVKIEVQSEPPPVSTLDAHSRIGL